MEETETKTCEGDGSRSMRKYHVEEVNLFSCQGSTFLRYLSGILNVEQIAASLDANVKKMTEVVCANNLRMPNKRCDGPPEVSSFECSVDKVDQGVFPKPTMSLTS